MFNQHQPTSDTKIAHW